MELPSVMQRSGVVSGNQLYMDQTGSGSGQLGCYRADAATAFAQQHHICNSNNSMLVPPDLKDEGLFAAVQNQSELQLQLLDVFHAESALSSATFARHTPRKNQHQ